LPFAKVEEENERYERVSDKKTEAILNLGLNFGILKKVRFLAFQTVWQNAMQIKFI